MEKQKLYAAKCEFYKSEIGRFKPGEIFVLCPQVKSKFSTSVKLNPFLHPHEVQISPVPRGRDLVEKSIAVAMLFSGGDREIRTPDLLYVKQML